MTIKSTPLAGIRRPRILIEAARIGGRKYRRKTALNQIFKAKRPQSQNALILALRDRESEIEQLRQLGDGTYRAQKHVQILTALIVENRRA